MTFLDIFKKPDLTTLLATLSGDSRIELDDVADRFVFDVTHRVQVWYDTAQAAHSDFGTLLAHRAITVRGALVWLVRATNRGLTYHADTPDPQHAMHMAMRTWDEARQLRDRPNELHSLIADVRRGRTRFQVRLEDATLTPLSAHGFRAALDKAGLFGMKHVSAATLVRLMKKDPLLAHVLFEAWQRYRSTPAPDARADNAPVGFEAMC